MHISQIENLEEFCHNTLGMTYYSIGPLGGPIETWQFTNDKYDQTRLFLGNFFFTKEEAQTYLEYMLAFYEDTSCLNQL